MRKITPFGEIEVFDSHVHFFSDGFFRTLIGQGAHLSGDPDPMGKVESLTGWTMPSGEPSELARAWIDEFDRHAVAGGMLIASVPGDEASVAAAVAAFPDRIRGGFMLDPTKPDAAERARRAFDELNLSVVCLFPAMQGFSMADHETVRAVVSLSAEHSGTAVFVHCGALSVGVRRKLGLPSRFDLRFSNPLDLHGLAAEFTTARFIVPHFGAGMFREALMLADLCPNVYLDTSSSNGWIKYQPAPIDLATVFRRALDVIGHRRLLFGTDSSFFPRGWQPAIFDAQVKIMHEIGLDPDQAQAILGGNFRNLLEVESRK
ncbi:MAG: amidohydrolase family protein [Acidobacteriota bacterium]|nr:MAG: amidohydrolase family protein [Acidobacteriota bacterium]